MMRRYLGLLAALAAVMMLLVACRGDSRLDADVTSAPTEAGVTAAAIENADSMAKSQTEYAKTGGIWVTGEGRVSVEPDLAVVNVGVESQAETVAQARADAAEAMSNVVQAVKGRGLTDADIQTTSFEIRPQYQYQEIERDGGRVERRVLVGYIVRNSAAIDIRDLDAIGPIVDDVAAAGGDLTRINGINFTVEDTKPFMEELRGMAFQEATSKAEHFADLAGVTLGELLSISEGGAAPAPLRADAGVMMEAAAMSRTTPISAGGAELRLTVSALFGIQAAEVESSDSKSKSQTEYAKTDIWVTGEGRVSVEPDLAVVNVGVESQAETVAQARADAAEAMSSVVRAVKGYGLTDADIQTTSFEIWPQYQYQEIERDGVRVDRQVLVGYTVRNSAAIDVRDLDAIGPIVDDVAAAGGDLTRINGINFTVEDTKPFMEELRGMAFQEAMSKAEHFADLAGVALGELLSISEGGAAAPDQADYGIKLMAAELSMTTPISAGGAELRLTVSALFGVQ